MGRAASERKPGPPTGGEDRVGRLANRPLVPVAQDTTLLDSQPLKHQT